MRGRIVVRSLGKKYKRYCHPSHRLIEWLAAGRRTFHQSVWVLRDVTFEVKPGEAVGIVGQNGAGKSTLLKIIAGTTQPTEGEIQVDGRVAALLELGMGFHPEFTGRENAFLAGYIMGLNSDEIRQLMPEIEAFAEIGPYIDLPLRTYSSGMAMRLAFAVATAIRPDVLIVDEALAVGDAYFQHKCFQRIKEFKSEGTTLLFVSHDPNAIYTLCDRAILLDQGRIVKEGDPETVMDYYNALIADRQNQTVRTRVHESGKTQTISGTGEATVEDIGLFDMRGQPVEVVNVADYVELRLKVRVKTQIPRLVLGFMIKDRLGQPIYGTNTHHTRQALDNVQAGSSYLFRVWFPVNLGPGSYSVSTALVSTDTHLVNNYEWKDLALTFTVVNLDKYPFAGLAWLPARIEIAAEEVVGS